MVTTHFGLYFMRSATVRPEKQQSIKVGFNVSKLGFASVTEDTLAALAHELVLLPVLRLVLLAAVGRAAVEQQVLHLPPQLAVLPVSLAGLAGPPLSLVMAKAAEQERWRPDGLVRRSILTAQNYVFIFHLQPLSSRFFLQVFHQGHCLLSTLWMLLWDPDLDLGMVELES